MSHQPNAQFLPMTISPRSLMAMLSAADGGLRGLVVCPSVRQAQVTWSSRWTRPAVQSPGPRCESWRSRWRCGPRREASGGGSWRRASTRYKPGIVRACPEGRYSGAICEGMSVDVSSWDIFPDSKLSGAFWPLAICGLWCEMSS